MGKIKKIFIKNKLLEKLEETDKGNLDSDLKLSLENGLIYQLTPAIKFIEKLEGDSTEKLIGKFFTYNELSLNNYDVYMDTAIIDDSTVYSFEEGFSGVLIENSDEENLKLIEKQIRESIEEHKELRKIMLSLGNSFTRDVCDCYNIDVLLEHFIKKLGVHLKKENNFLYNDFKDNIKLKSLAKIYIHSMDLINTIINEYYNKWSSNISANTKDIFFEETKDIIKILNDRIRQEENNLFPRLLKS